MAATFVLSSISSNLIHVDSRKGNQTLPNLFLHVRQRIVYRSAAKRNQIDRVKQKKNRFSVLAATEDSAKSRESEEAIPSWARPDSEEPPPWARDEAKASTSEQGFEFPFYVYLLASSVTAIAAVGSIFEYVNQRPVFGVLSSDSIFYAPLLGFFVFTGVPTSAFLWYKSVQVANKEAEEQDRRDGYM
ncbi:uncharacterized protein LOC110807271 [Carica papaya]|uniref:uncharacterized protein LOC110807271 n=1 Tax=Carica papaya TaxID=3649 RepID=UPI000B8CAB6B|nr:uncharacterized protein LOC110807271 [Carica papaya]XP_021888045.1 uncharacterized protein LOC110807271 [Carica papaya]XP_021888046.1 uncharacterized protein LOC110807271 [Carica papaya]